MKLPYKTYVVEREDGSTYEVKAHNVWVEKETATFVRFFDEASAATHWASEWNFEITKNFQRIRDITVYEEETV